MEGKEERDKKMKDELDQYKKISEKIEEEPKNQFMKQSFIAKIKSGKWTKFKDIFKRGEQQKNDKLM